MPSRSRVPAPDRERLDEMIRGLAFGYAEVDPEMAVEYRAESRAFRRGDAASVVSAFADRWRAGVSLRRKWFARFGRR